MERGPRLQPLNLVVAGDAHPDLGLVRLAVAAPRRPDVRQLYCTVLYYCIIFVSTRALRESISGVAEFCKGNEGP